MTSDEFTSALATAYNVHLSEVKGRALINGLN